METFSEDYAALYDVLYKVKDYKGEVAVIEQMIHEYAPGSTMILDYGCGTGNHARIFAEKGYTVYGVDKNESMLKLARQKFETYQHIHLYHATERNAITPASIDVCVTLFDVLSYMTLNKEIIGFLTFIKNVLKPQGLLIFDFWYGPGVIHLRPEKRWKEYLDGNRYLLRFTEPRLDLDNCLVDVTHQIVMYGEDQQYKRFHDTHRMRFFFKHEIQLFLEYHGFKILKFGTWNDLETSPTIEDWSALVVSQLVH